MVPPVAIADILQDDILHAPADLQIDHDAVLQGDVAAGNA